MNQLKFLTVVVEAADSQPVKTRAKLFPNNGILNVLKLKERTITFARSIDERTPK